MATYTSQPVKVSRNESPDMNPNSKNTLFIILLLATLGVGGYAWQNLNTRVVVLETQAATRVTATGGRRGGNPATTAVGGVNAAGAGFQAGGPGGPGGGRRGGGNNTANIIANLGLDDATATQLTELATQRQAAMAQAQLDAQNQGINRRGDPQGYQAILDAATATIDAQIGQVSPDALAALQAAANRGGGRRGGGGGGGG